MEDPIKVAAILGAVNAMMPLIVAVVVQQRWPQQAKAATALLFVMMSGIFAVVKEGVDPRDVTLAIPIAIAAMEASYRLYWKPTGIAPWIEKVTSLVRHPEGDEV